MKMKQWQKYFLNIWIPFGIVIFCAPYVGDWRYALGLVFLCNSILTAIALAIALQSNENKSHDRTPDCCPRIDAD